MTHVLILIMMDTDWELAKEHVPNAPAQGKGERRNF